MAHAAASPIVGYCTNVHAGASYDQMLANLREHALPVKQQVSPDQPMGIGLWLAAATARELIDTQRVAHLRGWLADHGLVAFTLNGFPFGNFHRPRVKHDVYQPDWRSAARFDYTLDLVHILSELLPPESEGSISTLPLGWPSMMRSRDDDAGEIADRDAADRLLDLVHHLARAELDTGKLIHVDLEPEPGCRLDTGADVVSYFERYLLDTPDELSVRSYLRICHDVCHAAVMFEDQAELLRSYERAGLEVGKVQVSSAVRVRFDDMSDADRCEALAQLQGFAEDRYLHQTVVRSRDGTIQFHDDLPDALAAAKTGRLQAAGEWRVHFHVPIYLERIGHLETTRDAIEPCLAAALSRGVRHFEAETYAWGVLPESLRTRRLADGIARELSWLNELMTSQPTR